MSLDKFSMETVDDLIFDAIEAVRGRYHKRPDKNSICKYLNVSTEAEKLYMKIGLTSYLNQTKLETKSFKVVTRTSLITTKILITMNSQKEVKKSTALIKMIVKVV